MIFEQYYLDCLSQASYLIGDETTGHGRRGRPAAGHREYLRRRPPSTACTIELRDRDPLPRRLPVRPPRAGRGDRRRDRLRLGRRRPSSRSRQLADGERIEPRRGRPRGPRHAGSHARVDQRRRLRARRRRRAVRRAHRRHAVHRRRRPARPARRPKGVTADELAAPALRLAARQAARPCPTAPGCTRPTAPARRAARTCRPRPWSTIGEQRRTNYALRADDQVGSSSTPSPTGQTAPPAYFAYDADAQPRAPRPPRRGGRPTGADARRGARRAALPARSCSTPATPHDVRRRPPAPARSTSASTAATPSTPAACVQPGAPIVLVTDAGDESRGQDPPRPHRLRPRGRRPRRPAARCSRSTPTDGRPAARASTSRELEQRLGVRRRRAGRSTSASPARPRGGTIAGRDRRSRSPGSTSASPSSTPARPTVVYCAGGYRSSIAASRWPRPASPTCPTCSAATAPGRIALSRP